MHLYCYTDLLTCQVVTCKNSRTSPTASRLAVWTHKKKSHHSSFLFKVIPGYKSTNNTACFGAPSWMTPASKRDVACNSVAVPSHDKDSRWPCAQTTQRFWSSGSLSPVYIPIKRAVDEYTCMYTCIGHCKCVTCVNPHVSDYRKRYE